MTVKIIAFSGKRESGKTTIADHIVENYRFTKASFGYELRMELISLGYPAELIWRKPTHPKVRKLMIAHGALRENDVFVTIEQGGDTILAFLFRPRSDRAFYTAELRELREQLTLNLHHRGKNAVYPYHREPLSLGLRGAIALYNPNVKPARQILKAVRILEILEEE